MLANYFFIAILEGEPRRFEPRPHQEAIRQKYLKIFHALPSHLQWCSGYNAANLCWHTRFKSLCERKFYTCFNHLYSIKFSLNIVNKLTK
jgi:hypothetical protein